MSDMSPPGHEPEGGGGFIDTLTQKWGPLPIWAYIAIPAGLYIVYAYYRASQTGEDTDDVIEEDFTDDEFINDGGGYPTLPGYPDIPGGTPNPPLFPPDTYTNAEWMQDAVRWAISQHINSLSATRAVTAYLYRRPSSLNSGDLGILQRIITAKGPAPEGSPTIPPLTGSGPGPNPPAVTVPKPPSNVVLRLNRGMVNGTWNPSMTPNVTYEVEKKVGATPWKVIGRGPERFVNFEVLHPNKVQIRVRARNAKGASKYAVSPILNVTKSTQPAPRTG